MNINKTLIRLTESDLHKIIKESVKRILTERNIKNYEDYTNLPLKDGGWDSYAYNYDKALDDAESIEDWDERMREREANSKRTAYNASNRHPSSTKWNSSIGASKYTHPETYAIKGDPEEELRNDVELGRATYGFPV